ncbi:MAG: 50S ribosomal protein L29 [Chitinophagia bacterium]|nr:50S ribosomal protein L29 [Chitinophagia bacterium]
MANTKTAEKHSYKQLDNETLEAKIAEQELSLKRLKFSHAVNPIENPLSIKLLRREIARLKTESRARQ